jgi:hypothetical protein
MRSQYGPGLTIRCSGQPSAAAELKREAERRGANPRKLLKKALSCPANLRFEQAGLSPGRLDSIYRA